jgi:hypothetical protein
MGLLQVMVLMELLMEEDNIRSPKLIFLKDILETKVRKEQELAYYQKKLEELEVKMGYLRQDINLTNTIINIIEEEQVIDFKEQMEKRLLIKDPK